MAIHFAGPTWQALDGSLVVGNAAKATHFPAPDQDGVDWLLIPAQSTLKRAGSWFTVKAFVTADSVAARSALSSCMDSELI